MDNEIGPHIKKIREHLGYPQRYMANQLGISQNTYSILESGRTHIKTGRLEKIATILAVPVDDIINGELKIFNANANKNNEANKDSLIKSLQEEVHYLREQNTEIIKGNNELIKTNAELIKAAGKKKRS